MKNLKQQIQLVIDIFKSNDFAKAETMCKELIEDNSKVVFLYNLLGLILSSQNKIDEALEYYEKGIQINPNFGMLYNNIGLLYFNHQTRKDLNKAEDYYQKSISIDKNIAEPHNNLGTLFNSQNKYEKAIKCYKQAIKINPNFYYAYYNLGTVNITLGNFDEAKANLKESIKINPKLSNAHRALSRITKYSKNDEHLNDLIKLYQDSNKMNNESKINFSFSLGKAYEDIGEYDKSFYYYKEGNTIFRKTVNFSIKNEKKVFKNLKKVFSKGLFDKFKQKGNKTNLPIFIVGMPRSGTTLIEQILSSHNSVYGADEIDFVPKLVNDNFCPLDSENFNSFFDKFNETNSDIFKKVGDEYVNKLKDLSKNSLRTTDKLPINFLYIGYIKLILPHSKIVHCYRNSKDNCLSIFKNHFTSGRVNFAYDLNETIEYYNLYHDLMKFWNLSIPNFIYNIKYENITTNTKSEIKNLLSYCDLTWDSNCLNFHKNKRPIRTASDLQARSKIYKTSVNSWKNYDSYLKKSFKNLKV